ncbi:opioid-binding protein/cell adhesion molecule isoform X2 [Patella vulgata]|uniref:opioid-binding protein/cell adhesion molecule isoform X2 n=1 Tax=Patella vulgata TaxID=6465 RepID=UPI0021805214|nr:opioid-binding protein/cell adhesion molecule isoform X2 [Patella vulgata]
MVTSDKMFYPCKMLDILLTLLLIWDLGIAAFAEVEKVLDVTPIDLNIVSGSTAILPCTVAPKYTEEYGDHYKVVWVNPSNTVISLQDRRMINDMRISVERPYLADWNLHIRNVTMEDGGEYKCQINTEPVKTKRIKLIVQVPPSIVSFSYPGDIKVKEDETVELRCNATGVPQPTVKWFRLNQFTTRERERVGMSGELLRIHNISRFCDDVYECVANNSVPPARSRQMRVTVQYPPEVKLPNTRISQELGKETILECVVSASPLGVTVWKKHERELSTSWKYEVDIYNEDHNTITISLRIANIDHEDFSEYTCEASNPLGIASAKMQLYEIKPKTERPTTTTTTTTSPRPPKMWNGKSIYLTKQKGVYDKNGHVIKRPYASRGSTPSTAGVAAARKPNGGISAGVYGTGSASIIDTASGIGTIPSISHNLTISLVTLIFTIWLS